VSGVVPQQRPEKVGSEELSRLEPAKSLIDKHFPVMAAADIGRFEAVKFTAPSLKRKVAFPQIRVHLAQETDPDAERIAARYTSSAGSS
jgi:hypothetical protein